MNAKNMTITTIAIVAVLGLSGLALAGPGWGNGYGGYCDGPGYGMGYGPGYGRGQQALTAEQQQAADQIFERHQDRVAELRDQMWAKNVELDALIESGNADRGDVQALTTEITALRNQMRAERDAMHTELAEAGIEGGFGPGFGPGQGRGYHREGRGYGRHMGW